MGTFKPLLLSAVALMGATSAIAQQATPKPVLRGYTTLEDDSLQNVLPFDGGIRVMNMSQYFDADSVLIHPYGVIAYDIGESTASSTVYVQHLCGKNTMPKPDPHEIVDKSRQKPFTQGQLLMLQNTAKVVAAAMPHDEPDYPRRQEQIRQMLSSIDGCMALS